MESIETTMDMSQDLEPFDRIARCELCKNYMSSARTMVDSGNTVCGSCSAGVSSTETSVPNFAAEEWVEKYRQLKDKIDRGEISDDEWQVEHEKQEEQFSFGLADDEALLEDKIPRPLQPMFDTLCCQICRNLYDNAVCIRVCGHSLCSYCIRDQLSKSTFGIHRRSNACSVCNAEIGNSIDKALIKNRPIQEAVLAFKELIDVLEKRTGVCDPDESEDFRRSSRRAAPVGSISTSGNDAITTRLPARNFDKMKLKDLKEMCSKYNLKTTGKEDEIKDRLKRFTVLWNAELDSILPRKPSELVRKIGKEERDKAAAKSQEMYNGSRHQTAMMKNLTSSLDHNNGIAGKNVSTGSEQFNEVLHSNFAKMIDQMKRRQANKQNASSRTRSESELKNHKEPLNGREMESTVAADAGKEPSGSQSCGDSLRKKAPHGSATKSSVAADSGMKESEHASLDFKVDETRGTNCAGESLEQAAVRNEIGAVQQGKTQEDAIEIDSDNDNDATAMCAAATSSDSMNKENDSNASPPGTQQEEQQLQHATDSKPMPNQNPYTKQGRVRRAAPSQHNAVSAKDHSTPVSNKSKRPSSSGGVDSSGAKRGKSPWQCPHCTFENDGAMQNVCMVCRRFRVSRER